jgi:hypothetical protein
LEGEQRAIAMESFIASTNARGIGNEDASVVDLVVSAIERSLSIKKIIFFFRGAERY